MTYGGESVISDDWELLPEVLDGGNAEDGMIDNTGSGILLMVPLTIEPLCWM